MVKQLQMVFLDTAKRPFTVRVDGPREDLTESEIQEAMEAVLQSGVFASTNGALESISKAQIVTTETTTYELM